ncbi:MAG: hypothetical protein HY561_02690 [Gemmatimonadetes bacterium]|nr:hypothetical protein [Gemmatimonadota bacterium]
MEADGGGEPVLRAKYLDWCSARVADRFLQLTPEQIYELAQTASRTGSPSGADFVGNSAPYRVLVERVTEVLASHIGLPPFEEWAEAYRQEPQRYDAELLGFWKRGLPG